MIFILNYIKKFVKIVKKNSILIHHFKYIVIKNVRINIDLKLIKGFVKYVVIINLYV